MAITSFIKPVDNDKGIFYTFQSARHDMSRTFNKNFRFSKYVLLRFPEMGTENDDIPEGNVMQFLAAGESPLIQGISSTDYNKNLAESFQNYCLNLEAALINQANYNPNLARTVTERIFWKWMKEIGAIRFRETDGTSSDEEKDYDELGDEVRYVEKDEFNFDETDPVREYNRVIKYLGEVAMVNSVKGKNAYTEVYIHVPTWVGNTPYVLFDTADDVNYTADMTILNVDADPANVEYLIGRKNTDTHPFGLSTLAFYDLDDSGAVDSFLSTDLSTQPGVGDEGRWFTETTNNAYYTDATFGDTSEARIYRELASDSGVNVDLIRSYMDGAVVDFDINNYWLANQNEDIQSFADLSAYTDSVDFEYNAVLLYYDILNPTTGEVLATNLFGIQFLNEVTQGSVKWSIPMTRKYMPDPINLTNGNAYAYKFNLKFDAYNGTVDVEQSINDYNTLSMDLYLDVLNASKDLTDKYSENLAYIESVKTEIDSLKRLFIDDTNKDELLIRINKLDDSYIANQALFENTDSVMTMINELYDKVNALTYTPSSTIVNEYNLINLGLDPEIDFTLTPYVTLQTGNNYVRSVSLQTVSVVELTSVMQIRIIDNGEWKRGQTFDVVFTGAIDIASYSIQFTTDSKNKIGSGAYNGVIATITSDMLDEDNTGRFQFICNDQDALTFYVDKIN